MSGGVVGALTQAEIVERIKLDPHESRYDQTILDLPTIESGHFSNLKLEWSTPTVEYRVWVSRMTREDGAKFDHAIELETRYTEASGHSPKSWRTFERAPFRRPQR